MLKKILLLSLIITSCFSFSQQNNGFKIELEDVYVVYNVVESHEGIDVFGSSLYEKRQNNAILALKRINLEKNYPKSIYDAVRMYRLNSMGQYSLGRDDFLAYNFRNGKYINSKIYSKGYYGLAEIETFNIKNQNGFLIKFKENLFNFDDFELNDGNTIETFRKINRIYNSSDWSAYIGASTYSNKRYLFIEKLGLNNKVKIDITENNPFFIHKKNINSNKYSTAITIPDTQRISNVFWIGGYWKIDGKDLVAVIGSGTKGHKYWTFYYLINNGKVEEIIYDSTQTNTNIPSKAKPQIFFLDNLKTIIEIKEMYLIQAFDLTGKKLWSSKLEGFSMINDIVGINNKIVIGGASNNVGYVGYNNPFLQILDLNTGKLLSKNHIGQKYASVNNMLVSGEAVYISTGYFEDIVDREAPRKSVKSLIIRDFIGANGRFDNNLFNNKESINLNNNYAKSNGNCDGNCEDGNGTYAFSDGDKYTGDFKNGKRTGKGTYNYSGGDKYTGDWIEGVKSGKGTYYFSNGAKYTGDWVDDVRTGMGIYYYSNGDKYEGNFIDGVFSGKGIKHTKNNIFEGEFKDDKLNGYGIQKRIREGIISIRCEGQFKNNLQNGYGKSYDINGNLVYEGEFLKGNKRGKGIMYRKGNRYEGNFDSKGLNGKGVLVFKNGDRYEGDFVRARMTGNGIYYYADGRKYIGEFKNKFNGLGELFDKDGNLLKKGQFVEGVYFKD
jgi:hypothetical protein